jgi:Zn finger protein HypA/HybF involved in hydrogenase expression
MRPFLNTEKVIEKCILSHGNRYDYSFVNYKDSKTKIKIKCKKCSNMFEQLPYNHYGAKRGCPKCYNIKSRNIQQLSINDFIKKSKKIHKNKYDYSLVEYINNRTKVKIKCRKCSNIFEQRPMHHIIGNGCPKCWHKSYTSKPEIDFLNSLNIKLRQQNIGGYIVDGVNNNTIYEFLGDYWHGNPKKFNSNDINKHLNKTFGYLYKKTQKRFKSLKKLGYDVKYIWEADWKTNKNGNLIKEFV